ncbi:nuclease-related domain-containing protein [Rossellomorea sp. AcN35-11]|nr:NERD domain-containing protein [Rossellomorea aquimaris]WJV30567.1 nuclease-related domain-containing protein [Rossellomorea sp. AcN35-11]
MDVNERKVPLKLLKLEAILGRLEKDYPKIPLLKEHLRKIQAGYNGEKAVDYQLGYLSSKDYNIFYDLRLEVNGRYFQIDTLILTRSFILIIEVKNMSGEVSFDTTFNQFIQSKNGSINAYPDPILQINRQEYQLKEWLKQNHFPLIPIHGFVVISNPQTIISANSGSLNKKVIHAASLPHKITQLQQHFHKKFFSDKELKKVIRFMKKMNTPHNNPILEFYKISKDDILPGVICKACGYLPLTREYGQWKCTNCHKNSKNAHIQAL